ncbi:hypothetical protein M3M38_07455 [Fructilactobacillus cliffordii]|uniref:hypothetical protein n=1 Tax=Fructilactobacillus cliffordii TaxID=2940299 RepID=UPI0020929902|nr:hypothetical protein [Fructilactobacillus cliffordii]USS86496.1 hypothetical protein M3M38_07455 [Fructilactobacillus cliffordii]
MTTVKINTKLVGLDKTICVHKTLDKVQGLQAIAADVSEFQGKIAQEQLDFELKDYSKLIADKKAEIAVADDANKGNLEHDLRILELRKQVDESNLSKNLVNHDHEFINGAIDRISELLELNEDDSQKIHENIPNEESFGKFIGYLKLRIIDGVSETEACKIVTEEAKKSEKEDKVENLDV